MALRAGVSYTCCYLFPPMHILRSLKWKRTSGFRSVVNSQVLHETGSGVRLVGCGLL